MLYTVLVTFYNPFEKFAFLSAFLFKDFSLLLEGLPTCLEIMSPAYKLIFQLLIN